MAKFLILNHPPPHATRRALVAGCVSHFVDLDATGRARVHPIVGMKGYATLVDVESHEELKEVLRGNSMGHIEEYKVIALAEFRD